MLGYGGAFRPTKFTFQIYDCLNRFSQNKNQLDGLVGAPRGLRLWPRATTSPSTWGKNGRKHFSPSGKYFRLWGRRGWSPMPSTKFLHHIPSFRPRMIPAGSFLLGDFSTVAAGESAASPEGRSCRPANSIPVEMISDHFILRRGLGNVSSRAHWRPQMAPK